MNRSECNLSLDELLKFDGVMAAGIFSPEGKLVDYKSKAGMPKEMAQMTAKFCGAVNMMFDALASAYTELYKMNWVPQHNWMYSGGDWTVKSRAQEAFSSRAPRQIWRSFLRPWECVNIHLNKPG